jgi:hypothetical protein
MTIIKKVAVVFVIFGAISIIFLTWYSVQHRMDEVGSFDINEKGLKHKVLIATQGSEYKDSVVNQIIEELRTIPIYLKVIDIRQLPLIHEREWSAIVILHAWENSNPQKDAEEFIQRASSKNKIIVVSTSERGDETIEGIDGITSASLIEQIPANARDIVHRVKLVLNIP